MPGLQYLDFDILLEQTEGKSFVRVLNSPAGQGSATFTLPFSMLDLENVLFRLSTFATRSRSIDSSAMEVAQAFGSRLFEALFDMEIRSLFVLSLDEAERQNMGLRLRLSLGDDQEMLDVPWELLYDTSRQSFLQLSPRSTLIRYTAPLQRPLLPLPLDLPLRVLVMQASPSDYPQVDVNGEWALLSNALESPMVEGKVTLERLESPTTLESLQKRLRRGEYHILHLIGQGKFDETTQEGALVLEDAAGDSSLVRAHSVGVLVNDHPTLRLVVLDACEGARTSATDPFARTARGLVRTGTPAVIATQFEISDAAVITVWGEFYQALAEALPLDAALAEARKAVFTRLSTLEWAAPALYTSLPDAQPFDISQRAVTVPGRTTPPTPSQAEALPETAPGLRLPSHVERDIRRLEAVTTVEEIATVHRDIVVPELRDQLSSLMRSFSTVSRDVEAALAQETAYNQREALSRVESRLADLAGQLTRGLELGATEGTFDPGYAAPLKPIAAKWRDIVAERVRALAATVEALQEIESPYVVGIPLTEEQQVFTGRSDISDRIQHLLLDRHSPSLMLYGQRRMGKTSLLYNLGRLLPSTIVPLFVDLQGPPTQADSHAGFLYHLADAMADSARRQRDLSVFVPPREAFSQDPFTRFYEWLDDFDAAIERRTALLMLDEFEALDRAFLAHRFDGDEVLSMLRHLIQHRPQFKVLLSGSHTLVEFERWASYLINVQVIKVGYLTESEARQLVERPVRDFQLRYEPRASNRVLALTRCHPFLIQLLCAEIVALKNEQAPAVRRRAMIEDVIDAVPRAIESGALFFSDIERNQVDENALALLRLISSRKEGVVAKKKHVQRDFSGDFDGALEALQSRDLIETVRGGYRVQVELIRRWFAR